VVRGGSAAWAGHIQVQGPHTQRRRVGHPSVLDVQVNHGGRKNLKSPGFGEPGLHMPQGCIFSEHGKSAWRERHS
jgi:hypothetical protein